MDEEAQYIPCSQCGEEIGEYAIGPDKRTWLKVGRLLLRRADGVCVCGMAYFWDVTDRTLEELLKRIVSQPPAA